MRFTGRFPAVALILSGFASAWVSGCGYGFQNSKNPLLTRYGVRKVFVAPLRNETLKPGIENVVYNELVKVIAMNRRVLLVGSREEADAVLTGSITDAAYSRSATATGEQLYPTAGQLNSLGQKIDISRPSANTQVATEYSASLAGSFSLDLVDHEALRKAKLEAALKQGKPVPAIPEITPAPSRETQPPEALLSQQPSLGLPTAIAPGNLSRTADPLEPAPRDRSHLWSGSFSRSQVFPGNNQLASFGTTGHLINDSEFDRALREIAESIMHNLHESMLAMF
jgi:hypothetical protein